MSSANKTVNDQSLTSTKGSIRFIAHNPMYETEKPYVIQYEPHGDIPGTNIKSLKIDEVPMRDLRSRKASLSFEKDGIAIRDMESKMSYEDFAVPAMVQKIYLEEVRLLLEDMFGTRNVAVVEYLVRRRHQEFPADLATSFEYAQPVEMAHIDFSPDCLKEILLDRYSYDRAASLAKYRYKMINVWKPLLGPVRDWPLALCHPASVDIYKDYELTDNVYPRNVDENIQIHYNENQDWCYLSQQTQTELLVFRGGDSKLGLAGGVPHCAFYDISCPAGVPARQSIEVRALVFETDDSLSLERVSPSRRHGPKSTYQQQ